MNVCKDYTIEDAIIVTEKAVKAIKIETINSCWRKLCPDAVHDFTGFMAEPIKEIMEETVDVVGKKNICAVGKGFQDMHLGEIQDQIEITPKELIEEDLMEMRAPEPVPNDEKKT